MPKFKPSRPLLARPALPRSRVVPAPVATQRLVAPVVVKPILPPKPKLRPVLRPVAKPFMRAPGPTQRPLVAAAPPVMRMGFRPLARPAAPPVLTERLAAKKLVRPVAPPVARLRNVLRPVAKPLMVAPPTVRLSRVVGASAPPIVPVGRPVVSVPSVVPVISPPQPAVRMNLRTGTPIVDAGADPRRLIRYITPAAADFLTEYEDTVAGGTPHGFLRLVRSQYAGARSRRGYGAATGMPTMKIGATDDASGGAVTWVATALGLIRPPQTYPFFDSALDAAVKDFQRKKGLTADGIVGKNTYAALGYTGTVATGSSGSGVSTSRGSRAAPSSDKAPVTTGGGAEEEGFFANLTQQVWFWPAAILVPTAGIIAGILLIPSKKKSAPVAAPAASTTLVPA